MKLAICDDHLTFGEALEAALSDRGHHVVTRSTTPYDAASFDSSDAVVLDLGFPGVKGCDAVSLVRSAVPQVPIVVMTAGADRALIERALDNGADGAVLKTERIDELESVLETVVAATDGANRRKTRSRVRSRQVQALATRRLGPGYGTNLTDRELEVLEHLSAGASTPDIAKAMGVQISTIRTHVQHLLTKFGVHSRLELVAAAKRVAGTSSATIPEMAREWAR
jgi:DNA-binding NarL/FixJ family response regulator